MDSENLAFTGPAVRARYPDLPTTTVDDVLAVHR
jgi:hypothetical protein